MTILRNLHGTVSTWTLVEHPRGEIRGAAAARGTPHDQYIFGLCVWVIMTSHRSVVKYIHLKDVDMSTLHTTDDYELEKAVTSHASYAEMELAVRQKCPSGFVCQQPIALHHEVLWRLMLRKNGKNLIEVDELSQPIGCADYDAIQWSEDPMLSVCVHVEPIVSVSE